MNKQPYKIEIIKKIDQQFISEWKHLWEKAENADVYNSYEWFAAEEEMFKDKIYEIISCYQNEKLVAVLPLENYRIFGINIHGTLDNEHLVETPFLMEKYDKKLFKFFFESLFKRNVYIHKIDSKAAKILRELFPNLFIVLMSVNPILDLTDNPYEFASPSTISQVKRILRKNEGKFRLETFKDNLQRPLELMFKLQESSSKKAKSMDIFAKNENKTYYRFLIKHCKEFVRINILHFGKEPIVYEFGFMYKNHYTGDQISYHQDYRKLSPGKIMMYHLYDYLHNHGVRKIDMGGGISSYKMSFAQNYKILYSVYYSPNIIIVYWWKLITKARRVNQILFPKKFTRDHEFLFKTL